MKKKIFTLMTLALMTTMGVSAQSETIFSATCTATGDVTSSETEANDEISLSSYATIQGGTMTAKTINKTKVKCVVKDYFYFGTNSLVYEIVLDEALQVGDKFSVTLKDTNGLSIFTEQKAGGTESSPSLTGATTAIYQVTEDDGLAGLSTIYLARYTGSTANCSSITITRNDAPEVATPVITAASYDYEKGGYPITITSTTEDATISYKVGNGNYTDVANGTTVYVEGGELKVKASKEGYTSSEEVTVGTLNAAPSSTSPETLIAIFRNKDTYDNNIDHDYVSVTVPANYVAGTYNNNDGMKYRCQRNDHQ